MKKVILALIVSCACIHNVFANKIRIHINNGLDHIITYDVVTGYGFKCDDGVLFGEHEVDQGQSAEIMCTLDETSQQKPVMLLQVSDSNGYILNNNRSYLINAYFKPPRAGSDTMRTKFELLSQNNDKGELVMNNGRSTITLTKQGQ